MNAREKHHDAKEFRGFILLMVLLVVALLSAVAMTQLAAVESNKVAQSKIEMKTKSRWIAERCAGIVNAFVDDQINGDDSTDGDASDNHAAVSTLTSLLNANTSVTTDDYLPPTTLGAGGTALTGTRVQVPASTTDTGHQFMKYNIDVSTGAGAYSGACFVRFDDNSDEGSGTDAPLVDVDKGITVTIIGVAPRSGTDSEQYARAISRTTIKRFRSYATGTAASAGGQGVWAGNSVSLGTGSIVCGTGGITSNSLTFSGTCVCGGVDAQSSTTPPICTSTQCPSPDPGCSTGSNDTAADATGRPDPHINFPQPATDSFIHNEGFAPTDYATSPMVDTIDRVYSPPAVNLGATPSGNNNPCKIYFQHDVADTGGAGAGGYIAADKAHVYVWDWRDSDASKTLDSETNLGGYNFNLAVSQAGTNVTAVTDPITNDDCTNYSTTITDKPCNWGNGTANPTAVACTTTETPCWKLVARLDDAGAEIGGDFSTNRAGTQPEQDKDGFFRAVAGELPYMVPNGGTAAAWSNVCANAPLGTPANTVTIGANGAGVSTLFTLTNPTKANFPYPSIVIFDSGPSDKMVFDPTITNTAPMTLLVSGSINYDEGLHVCPGCSETKPTSTCSVAGTGSSNWLALSKSGRALKAMGTCSDDDGSGSREPEPFVIGEIKCANFGWESSCVVGNMVATESTGTLSNSNCNPGVSSVCDTNVSICFKNNTQIIGDVLAHGSICYKNNVDYSGDMYSENDIGYKNNGSGDGQLVAEQDIGVRGGADVTFTGSNLPLVVGATGISSALWMESAW